MEIVLNKAGTAKKSFSLTDINMTINSNRINTVIGNGKTTLLEMIIGINKNTSGTILYDGIEMKKAPKSFLDKIAYIVENPDTQFIYKTVLKEFERINKDLDKIMLSLSYVGMNEEVLMTNPMYLSNGEKRKIGLAQAILKDAELIVMDEPSLGLDHASRKAMAKLLKNLKKDENRTIVIASNDTEFIHMLADHVFVLANGQIIFEGDKYKVFKEEEILASYGIDIPNVVKFSNVAFREKEIKLGYRDEINDLIKDIYRHAK